ncbi:hypothetical protein [Flavimarina sp. Hel_I_48]|uniref:hypothetical protein n=1 Tax=Flavimarina sp. Hel_I_48 TaxID=1392488 RepID=UPI0004DF0453|nr:hypothetical protein [Flavimarina sp. Hel_I_48]
MTWTLDFFKKNRVFSAGVILLILSITILNNSYFHHDGYVSPDSAEYLAIAKELKENQSAFYKVNPAIGDEDIFFSTWPLGYPTVIALCSALTSTSVFVASKILNLFVLMLFLWLLNYRFKGDAISFYPLLFTGGFIYLLSATLSELFFCSILLGIFILLEKQLYGEYKNKFLYVLCLSTLVLILPLIRYVGIFLFFFLSLYCLILISKKRYKDFWLHSCSLIIAGAFYTVYLYCNIYYTSEITGISRPFALNFYFFEFIKALFGQIIFIYPGFSLWAIILQITIIFIWYLTEGKYLPKISFGKLSMSTKESGFLYISAGILYFLFIFFLGSLSGFKNYNFRFLFPGTSLFFVGIVINLGYQFMYRMYKLLLVLSFTSISYNSYLLLKTYQRTRMVYNEKVDHILGEAEKIPSKSVIIFPPKHLKYLTQNFIFFDGYAQKDENLFIEEIKNYYPDYKIFTFKGDNLSKRLK